MSESKAKICPILTAGALAGGIVGPAKKVDCAQGECQFWTGAYTIEGHFWSDCAFVVNATKNSDGRIPV